MQLLPNPYRYSDLMRRSRGRLLDIMGLGALETPSRIVLSDKLFSLKAYAEPQPDAPTLLLVPAPIKKAYIWDLCPDVSVVRAAMAAGLNVYMLEWQEPAETDETWGLESYANTFILRALEAIQAETRSTRISLAGHSLGGTLAALFSALHPERVERLVLLASPLHFGQDAFAPLISLTQSAEEVTRLFGNVPGSFLNLASAAAAPESFQAERVFDFYGSLRDPARLRLHLRAERWTLDEMTMPRQLFEEVVDGLYREDRFMGGTLELSNTLLSPERITAPLLCVIDRRCRVVPPKAMLPFIERVSSPDKRTLDYGGDVGVALQHLGMLIGKGAHATLWPEILAWLKGTA